MHMCQDMHAVRVLVLLMPQRLPKGGGCVVDGSSLLLICVGAACRPVQPGMPGVLGAVYMMACWVPEH